MTDLEALEAFEKERATYKEMTFSSYVKLYCNCKLDEFWQKNLPRIYEQTPYYDNTYYYDDERHITIAVRYYLGD